ncbi:unnamed protein product [Rotaria socialis]|uniref:Uncharacterized protein n=1 Tax=Rotaria socialis TaxID=392032 RepID=A0A817TUY0_9BILA|nr:unnamed protein product [Rotaria socialis]CAF4866651.1 unnamed protein product [Rotaria socialis]
MLIKTLILVSLVSEVFLIEIPTPPNPKQFTITAGKPTGAPQIEVTTNYVDRFADLFRIDVTNEGRLTEQAFYDGGKKTGYLIYYDENPPRCTKSNENDADMLEEWQTLSYAGKTKSISKPHIECNMWNKTVQSWTWSYLASVKDNTPIEILDNSILISVFTNYTVGPSVVPKSVFDLPVPERHVYTTGARFLSTTFHTPVAITKTRIPPMFNSETEIVVLVPMRALTLSVEKPSEVSSTNDVASIHLLIDGDLMYMSMFSGAHTHFSSFDLVRMDAPEQ